MKSDNTDSDAANKVGELTFLLKKKKDVSSKMRI